MRRCARLAVLWLAVGVSVLVAEESLKAVVARPRPRLWATLVRPSDFAFPSGHAMASAAGLSAFVGLGRLYLGVHWPSDVLAGWALGGAVAVVAIRYLERGGVAGGPR